MSRLNPAHHQDGTPVAGFARSSVEREKPSAGGRPPFQRDSARGKSTEEIIEDLKHREDVGSREAFRLFDKDGDGVITKASFLHCSRQHNHRHMDGCMIGRAGEDPPRSTHHHHPGRRRLCILHALMMPYTTHALMMPCTTHVPPAASVSHPCMDRMHAPLL